MFAFARVVRPRVIKAAVLIVGTNLITGSIAVAQNYPSSPVRILVPWSAGGASDTAARVAMDAFGRAIGGRVFVENRPGASGITGTASTLHGKADGYTVLLGAMPNLVLIPAVKKVSYETAKDLVPLGMIWDSPHVLVVNSESEPKSMSEFVARAKQKAGAMTIGAGGGVGSMTHMANILLQRETGTSLINVPYSATAGAITDVLGRRVDSMFGDVALIASHIDGPDAKLRALAVTAPKRSFLLPGVPTMAEVGYPSVQSANWYGLFAPAGMPPEILAKLQEAVLNMQNDPLYIQTLAKHGIEIHTRGSEAFRTFVAEQSRLWTPIIKNSDVRF